MKQGAIWGVVAGLIIIVFSVILWTAGMATEMWAGIVSLVVSVVALAVGVFLGQRRAGEGETQYGYGKALLVGIVAALSAAVLVAIYTYLDLGVLNPGHLDEIRDATAGAYQQFGMAEEAIDAAVARITVGRSVITNLISLTVIGMIISLITAAITKKKALA
jgi:hypothetical protein